MNDNTDKPRVIPELRLRLGKDNEILEVIEVHPDGKRIDITRQFIDMDYPHLKVN